MQLTVKALQGRECSLQVSEDELVSTLKHLVSEKLNVPVRQQRLLFKGKALADGKRLSDYSIGPNSKLNLVVKPLEKVLLEESAARRLAEAPPPPPVAWQLVSKVLARHFSAADASRVLDQLHRDYERSLSRLTLDDIERLASRFLHPEVTEAMEKGFSKDFARHSTHWLTRQPGWQGREWPAVPAWGPSWRLLRGGAPGQLRLRGSQPPGETYADNFSCTKAPASPQASASGSEDGCLQLPPHPSITASKEHPRVL
uniref:Ubiquitin-like protein 4A n=1 Tax=Catagonus wagneri TaxID=51154 RepID=A0A8C3YBE4_9CETA